MRKDYKEHKLRMHLDERGMSQDLEQYSVGYCEILWRGRVLCCCEGCRGGVGVPVYDGRSWLEGDRGGTYRRQGLRRNLQPAWDGEAQTHGSCTLVAPTMFAVGKDGPATDCWFRESSGSVHKVFDAFGDRHTFWTAGVQGGTWQIYSCGYGVY